MRRSKEELGVGESCSGFEVNSFSLFILSYHAV